MKPSYLETEVGLLESRPLHGRGSGFLTPRPDFRSVRRLRQASFFVLDEAQRVLLSLDLGCRLALLDGSCSVEEAGGGG